MLSLVLGAAGTLFFALRASQETRERAATVAQVEANPELVRLSEAAALVGENPDTVRHWVALGWLDVHYADSSGEHPRLLRLEVLAAAQRWQEPLEPPPVFPTPPADWQPDEGAGGIVRGPMHQRCPTCERLRQGSWVSQDGVHEFTCHTCHTVVREYDEERNHRVAAGYRARRAAELPEEWHWLPRTGGHSCLRGC